MTEIAPGIHRIEEDLGPRLMAQYVLVGVVELAAIARSALAVA